jgi:hypothetical protein
VLDRTAEVIVARIAPLPVSSRPRTQLLGAEANVADFSARFADRQD